MEGRMLSIGDANHWCHLNREEEVDRICVPGDRNGFIMGVEESATQTVRPTVYDHSSETYQMIAAIVDC